MLRKPMNILLDDNGIAASLARMADEIVASIPGDCHLGVVGIRSRGDDLGRRLIDLLAARGFDDVPMGTLDITLYRDDLAEIGPSAVVRTTEIPFDIEGRTIILVDDVLFTGRSVRAALAAIIDLGRPKAIRLAVLVARGGRELPIQADFVGMRTDDADQHVSVMLRETSGLDRVEVGT